MPALPAGKRTKIVIKREFADNMGPASGLTGFERAFRESLDDADNHRADVREFLEACTVRAGLDPETFAIDPAKSRELTRDVMALISAVRARGRNEMFLLSRIHLSTSASSLCQLNGLPSGFEP